MEHQKKLTELNEMSLQEVKNYLDTKTAVKPEDHEKITQATEEWQVAWSKFLAALLVLERIEI